MASLPFNKFSGLEELSCCLLHFKTEDWWSCCLNNKSFKQNIMTAFNNCRCTLYIEEIVSDDCTSFAVNFLFPISDTANGAKVTSVQTMFSFPSIKLQHCHLLLHSCTTVSRRPWQETRASDWLKLKQLIIFWNLFIMCDIMTVWYSENLNWGNKCYFIAAVLYLQQSDQVWIIATAGRLLGTGWCACPTFSSETEPQPIKQHAVHARDACAQAAFSQVSHLCHFCISRVNLNTGVGVKCILKGCYFCVVLHRLSSPDSPFERDRGRTRSSRRRQTDYQIHLPATPPLSNYGNHAGSEDSNSEHSYTSYKSSPCQELPYQSTLTHPSPVGCYGPPAIPWNGFYHNSKYQSSPNFHRGYHNEEMVYPPHLDLARSYYAQRVPCNQNRYEYSAVPNHRGQWPLPPNPRLSPSPAKYESPHHRPNSISPQVVNEQLKSWHRRSQLKAPRSRSLDRQGAIRLKNTPGQEATYYQSQKYNEQVIA